MACPYGVRYLNEESRVVEKCTLCEQRTAQGELPHQQLVQLQPWVDAANIKTIQEALDSFELVQAQHLLAQLIT